MGRGDGRIVRTSRAVALLTRLALRVVQESLTAMKYFGAQATAKCALRLPRVASFAAGAHSKRKDRACGDRVGRIRLVLEPALATRVVVHVVGKAALLSAGGAGSPCAKDPRIAGIPPAAAACLWGRPECGATAASLRANPCVCCACPAASRSRGDMKIEAPHVSCVA
eukprot:CAMPEP_0119382814 /NCGR_PEP_ID=MMETSP1334-20130426/75025_1 /TAXON_ID=127549 /ORGANISM="Calcidiscus leptoporus, Strain RCC1130" /LENGTH=167 /DNA_ID=CAMNT_0007403415 /DNA_START=235 /DNA_END=742 /DNA_ORIENTATION=+